tara:strand:- start:14 stop:496 length:483 start_codon:yes stop_codon:yes gene_type:complete
MTQGKHSKSWVADTLNRLYDSNDHYIQSLKASLKRPDREIDKKMLAKIKEIPILLQYLEEKLDSIIFDEEMTKNQSKTYRVEVESNVILHIKVSSFHMQDAERLASSFIKKEIEDSLSKYFPKVFVSSVTKGSAPSHMEVEHISTYREKFKTPGRPKKLG